MGQSDCSIGNCDILCIEVHSIHTAIIIMEEMSRSSNWSIEAAAALAARNLGFTELFPQQKRSSLVLG